jgi:hypothetical protein
VSSRVAPGLDRPGGQKRRLPLRRYDCGTRPHRHQCAVAKSPACILPAQPSCSHGHRPAQPGRATRQAAGIRLRPKTDASKRTVTVPPHVLPILAAHMETWAGKDRVFIGRGAEIAAVLSDLAAHGDVSRLPKSIVVKH